MGKNYRKRMSWFRVALLLYTAVIIFSNIFMHDALAGCAGDCMTCHPKLVGDITHMSLTTCIKCHEPVQNKEAEIAKGGCGDRCFQCHSQWPKDGSHASLNTCLNCHEK